MENRPKLTTDQIDAILSDFAHRLREAAEPLPAPEPAADFSWSILVEQLVALRHEVHLHTKALRQQQEQVVELLRHVSAANPSRSTLTVDEGGDSAIRPVLESLIELADMHGRAAHELNRILTSWNSEAATPNQQAGGIPSAQCRRWWHRLRGLFFPLQSRPSRAEEKDQPSPADTDRSASPHADRSASPHADCSRWLEKLLALAEGFRIGTERTARILGRHGLEAIPTVGQPFDPQTMEAVEVTAAGPEIRPGSVAAEIRRGYLWRGRVFRTAQVQVAKASESPQEADP
ncbi:MAG: nucleotide exchange factor GrpE [Gemmataceae bacterium]|nr:nucleotide exchange factor GrpE [Gemmataceae bacterium]